MVGSLDRIKVSGGEKIGNKVTKGKGGCCMGGGASVPDYLTRVKFVASSNSGTLFSGGLRDCTTTVTSTIRAALTRVGGWRFFRLGKRILRGWW